MQEDVEILKVLTKCTDESLLGILLEDAKETVLSYTNRKNMIPQLRKPIRDLALIAYNRQGTEGEKSRSEGGESYSFDNTPKQIYDILNRYRLARVGGKVYEASGE